MLFFGINGQIGALAGRGCRSEAEKPLMAVRAQNRLPRDRA